LGNIMFETLEHATQAQRELTAAFEAIGMNFSKLNPIVHNALLKEALATSAGSAMANFNEVLSTLQESTASEEGKLGVLREFYAYRAKQFSDWA
jgi:ABC-type transporter Mla subunit MlaD